MILRIATLNTAQNLLRWESRRDLIAAEMSELKPDILALNEIHLPTQTGRWLQRSAAARLGAPYVLLQQPKVGDETRTVAEGLLTRRPFIETLSLDYRCHNCVAQVARFEIGHWLLDVFVTHLIAARVQDSARQYQAKQLIEWAQGRCDADFSVICGDFNAPPDEPSIQLMLEVFRPTQTHPTAFTPLQDPNGAPAHPEWPRFDRCIDYIWTTPGVNVAASGLCFNEPSPVDPTLWPSDHVGVWADLKFD